MIPSDGLKYTHCSFVCRWNRPNPLRIRFSMNFWNRVCESGNLLLDRFMYPLCSVVLSFLEHELDCGLFWNFKLRFNTKLLTQEYLKNIKSTIYGDFSKSGCQVLSVFPANPVLADLFDVVPELVNLLNFYRSYPWMFFVLCKNFRS